MFCRVYLMYFYAVFTWRCTVNLIYFKFPYFMRFRLKQMSQGIALGIQPKKLTCTMCTLTCTMCTFILIFNQSFTTSSTAAGEILAN